MITYNVCVTRYADLHYLMHGYDNGVYPGPIKTFLKKEDAEKYVLHEFIDEIKTKHECHQHCEKYIKNLSKYFITNIEKQKDDYYGYYNELISIKPKKIYNLEDIIYTFFQGEYVHRVLDYTISLCIRLQQ